MSMITAEDVRRVLAYDPETGDFTWRETFGRAVRGAKAGNINGRGYVTIKFRKRTHQAHRLAWLYVHGEWPNLEIDHINCDKTDNRLSNLRLATGRENVANTKRRSDNSSGHKGVFWDKQRNRWHARIMINGKNKHIGLFRLIEDAAKAYERAAIERHGEFARTV